MINNLKNQSFLVNIFSPYNNFSWSDKPLVQHIFVFINFSKKKSYIDKKNPSFLNTLSPPVDFTMINNRNNNKNDHLITLKKLSKNLIKELVQW